jgi:hypothetical protein
VFVKPFDHTELIKAIHRLIAADKSKGAEDSSRRAN